MLDEVLKRTRGQPWQTRVHVQQQ